MTSAVRSTGALPRRGAIAAPHHLATKAGEDAFAAGGNAIDAAVAAAAVLTVVYPNNVALGSDLVALVRSPDGDIRCVNATGFAPQAQNATRLRELYGAEIGVRGIDTVTVPGAVRGWEAMRSLGARLDWAANFTDAIRYAHGVPVARSVAAAILEDRDDLLEDEGCRNLFFPGGIPLAEGDLLAQPHLAQSLKELQADGADALYGGTLGQRLVDGMRRLGGVMTLEDLAGFQPEIVDPLVGEFRGYDIITSPPNTQGFLLLRALAAIERMGGGDELGEGAGALARIFEEGNAVRNVMLADPRHAGVSVRDLIDGKLPESVGSVAGSARAAGDTVGISAIDSDGFAVSLIQSVFHGFGSAVLEPQTGILLQNRGTSFSLDEDSPNLIGPGKRPRHTLMPVLVARDNEIRWVSSTMGGQGQPQIHAQLLLASLGGSSATEAVSAPRWMVGISEPGDTDDTVYVESDAAAAAARSLDASGLTVKTVPPHSEALGHANLIKVAPDGRFDAASDPRADGSGVEVELPA